jgi:carboxyl-terminal processing protease
VGQQRGSGFARFAGLVSLAAIVFILGFGSGYALSAGRYSHFLARTDLIREADDLVATHYSGPLPDTDLLQRGMIRGMLEAVGDPYTTYQTPSEGELEKGALEGEFGGIGAVLSATDGTVYLVPYVGGPAALAGILEGDQLLQVDGLRIEANLPLGDISAAIRGDPGTDVALRIARGPQLQNLEYVITRRVIPLPSVTAYVSPLDREIGIIRLTNFTQNSADEVGGAIEDLLARGVSSLILDVRGNPGGLLDAALDVADLFIDQGIILIEGADDEPQVKHLANNPSLAEDLPLIVLVDGGTASAAEVVASALAANGRAVTIGAPTFGKGSVQSIFGLSDGSTLHITTARWFTPDGMALDQVGLFPMIEVPQDDLANDTAMQRAVEWLADKGFEAR